MKKSQRPSSSRKSLLSNSREIPPRPAFRPFVLEDEQFGRRRLRTIGNSIDWAEKAPNASIEILLCFHDARGDEPAKLHDHYDQDGKIFCTRERVPLDPEEAARNLFKIGNTATTLLSLLIEKKPELCKAIAATKSHWPVVADMTEKDWQRAIEATISKLDLGKDISGYLLSARTADGNVIRCWATAIYETLFQTRFDVKEAMKKKNTHVTLDGWPQWARKTLHLPPFTKADARKWAKLGEEMLLEQRPDFLESHDLAGKKRSWAQRAQQDSRSGKPSLRAIHREAFEDFAKEIKNIAPERNIWRGNW